MHSVFRQMDAALPDIRSSVSVIIAIWPTSPVRLRTANIIVIPQTLQFKNAAEIFEM